MKNVDKQWNKRGCNSIDECEQIGDCRDCKDVWVAGFKVALEWALSIQQTVKLSPHPDATSFAMIPALEIEKELKDETICAKQRKAKGF